MSESTADKQILDLLSKLREKSLEADQRKQHEQQLRSLVFNTIKRELGALSIDHAEDYSGFSGAFVFLAWVTYQSGVENFLVIKVGNPNQVEREKKNWKQYAQHLTRVHTVQLKDLNATCLLLYDTASPSPQGAIRRHQEFRDHYRKVANPWITLEYLFESVLTPWRSPMILKLRDIAGTFANRLKPSAVERIRATLESLLTMDLNQPGINLHNFAGKSFVIRNPFKLNLFPIKQQIKRLQPVCVAHGDLNAKNILLFPQESLLLEGKDQAGRVITQQLCLIDFFATGISSAFADPVRLERDIKFTLPGLSDLPWDKLLAFEDYVTKSVEIEPPGSLPYDEEDPRFKAAWCLAVLRRQVKASLDQFKDRVTEFPFWLSLYVDSLKPILYEDLTPKQKLYAFFSACLIFDRHIFPEVK